MKTPKKETKIKPRTKVWRDVKQKENHGKRDRWRDLVVRQPTYKWKHLRKNNTKMQNKQVCADTLFGQTKKVINFPFI